MAHIINLSAFSGLAPGIAPTNLPPSAATVANNCILASSTLRPLKSPLFVATPSKAGTKKTIYPYSNKWLHWIDDVDVARSPVAMDAWDRVYWTGDGVPKYSVNSIITAGGGTNYPTNSYTLGLPVPENNATVTPEAYSAAKAYTTGNIVRYNFGDYQCLGNYGPEAWNAAHWQALEVNQSEAYSYLWRFVTAYGEEGPCSPPTVAITTGIGQKKTLTNCPTHPGGNYNITKKRLYRTLTDTSGATTFNFCLEVDIAVTTVDDTVADSSLRDAIPEADWIAPPADLKGLINLPYGGLAGFSGNTLCLTPPNQPHAWPLEYQYSCPYPIVAIGAFGNNILVSTTALPYIVYGANPESMRRERLEDGESCLSKRGLVDMGDSVIYPSKLGLISVGGGSVTNLTESLMTGHEWMANFKPTLLSAYQHEGRYIAFHDTGGFIFDPRTKDLTTIDIVATAGYLDPTSAVLYLQVGSNIVAWDSGAAPLTATWRGKTTVTRPLNPGAAKVSADTYPVVFNLYGDGILRYTKAVQSSEPFALPDGYECTAWQPEVSGTNGVTDIKVAAMMEDFYDA